MKSGLDIGEYRGNFPKGEGGEPTPNFILGKTQERII